MQEQSGVPRHEGYEERQSKNFVSFVGENLLSEEKTSTARPQLTTLDFCKANQPPH